MRIAVLTEVAEREQRVALIPDVLSKLIAAGHEIVVEAGAGLRAGFTDDHFAAAGARVVSRDDVIGDGGVVLQVRVSGTHGIDDGVRQQLGPDHILVGLVDPLWMSSNVSSLAATGASVLSLELVPRITRAQSMDVLSSMSTVSGYESVLLAGTSSPQMFPMLMTAAGTVPPTRVLVLGAGVAGLQAIATAKRLGAVVEAYDVRPAAAEQIGSVGGKAIQLDFDIGDSEDDGGYATAQTEDQNTKQQRLLTPFVAESDVIITTAAIPGAPSPELITTTMVESMQPGSVIVDLAAERGGNCSLTRADEVVDHHGVAILGPTDLPSRSQRTASRMLANNIVSLLTYLSDPPGESSDGGSTPIVIDPSDEIAGPMLVASGGNIVHQGVLDKLKAG